MAILYGTTGDGTTLPVLVDQFGNLLAKGIEGAQGIPGPIGPPGVGELPPGATDGALLGWENGELVWVTEPVPPVVVPGFRPVIYQGNGTGQSIKTGFSPDLVWTKIRGLDNNHFIYDTLRGTNAFLNSNNSVAQGSNTNSIVSFDDDGFTVGDNGDLNGPGYGLVAWCWDAGDTTVTNDKGTIESQVRSNGSFSVVSFNTSAQGVQNIGHGLSEVPAFVITKQTNGSSSWNTYHEDGTSYDELLDLNETRAVRTNSQCWGSASDWNDSTFGLNTSSNQNGEIIAYCWAATPGLSHFGSYQSTGMRTFIHVGFLPSMVIIKSISTGHWFMFDNARGTQYALRADESAKEDEIAIVEFKDDGFQLLFAFPGVNTENETYIYATFANQEDALIAQRQLRRQARQEERQQNETRLR